jgi:hypothetical protein
MANQTWLTAYTSCSPIPTSPGCLLPTPPSAPQVVGRTKLLPAAKGDGPRLPVAHMVCNQSPPVDGQPSLMTFRCAAWGGGQHIEGGGAILGGAGCVEGGGHGVQPEPTS